MSHDSDHVSMYRIILSQMRKAAAAGAYHILKDHHKAEDVAQDVMLAIFGKLELRAPDAHSGATPSVVLIHKQCEYEPHKFAYWGGIWKARDLRRRGARQEILWDSMDVAPDVGHDNALQAFEARDMFRHIWGQIPDKDRDILRRSVNGQMQNASDADRKRLQRARAAARALYSACFA